MERFTLKHTFHNIKKNKYYNQWSLPINVMNGNCQVGVFQNGDYLNISLRYKTERTYYTYIHNIELNLLSNTKDKTCKDDCHVFYANNYYTYKSILWQDLFEKKNGYVNNDSITVEVNFIAYQVDLTDDALKEFISDLYKNWKESSEKKHSLDIEKQNKKLIELENKHCKQITDYQIKQDSFEKIVEETKIIMDLLAHTKYVNAEGNPMQDFNDFFKTYKLVKQEIDKLEQNNNKTDTTNTTENKFILTEDMSKRIVIFLAKLKVENEDLEDENKIIKTSKKRLEKRMQTLRYQLEGIIQVKENEAEKQRREIVKEVRNIESDLETERKEHAKARIANKNMEYKLEDVVRELNSVKIELKNKEEQLRIVEVHLDKEIKDLYKERTQNIEKLEMQLKNLDAELEKERKQHTETKIEKNKVETKLQDANKELSIVKFDLENSQMQLKNIKAELDVERQQHAASRIEFNLLGVHKELSKFDLEHKQSQLKNIEDDLDVERKQHIDTREALKKAEANVKEMERKLINEESFKKFYQQVKDKLVEDVNLKLEINNLEEQLEISTKENLEHKIANRKFEKEIKELTIYLEEKIWKIKENQKEIKNLRFELDKAKEDINKEIGEKLKTLRKYEDVSELLEILKQDNADLKKIKLRKGIKSSTSSFCEITEEEDSISIISENEYKSTPLLE